MKIRFNSVILGITLLLTGLVSAGTAPLFVNNGLIQAAPQIDATAFLNNGTISLSASLLPFDTQNTLYFTNRGTLSSLGPDSGGFRFDYVNSSTGIRKPAATILNDSGSVISATDSLNGYSDGPFIILNATNIINKGAISILNTGLIQITGSDVNLSRGSLDVQPFSGSTSATFGTNFFFPELGVSDLDWNVDTVAVNTTKLLNYIGTNNYQVTTPIFNVISPGGIFGNSTNRSRISLFNPLAFVYTNQLDSTNQVVQVVFVSTSDTNIDVTASFADSVNDANPFKTAVLQFSAAETNIISGNVATSQLFLVDTLASDTNAVLIPNYQTQTTFRPGNYEVSRVAASGLQPNAQLRKDLFRMYYDTNFTNGMAYSNNVVTNIYATYDAGISYQSATIPGATITDSPGRVEITADSLDLSKARIRAEVMNIRALNLKSSSGATLDVPAIYYDLGATNGNLLIQNLTLGTFFRFASGDFNAWSTIWTNSFDNTTTNVDSSGNTNTVDTVYNTMFHVLVVDATALTTQQAGELVGLTARSTNTVVADTANVAGSLLVLSQALTINGQLNLGGAIGDWSATNAPNLLYLTNNGNFTPYNLGHYGDDRAIPYETFVNNGTNSALGLIYNVKQLVNSGFIQTDYYSDAGGAISINSVGTKIDGGRFSSKTDLTLTTSDLKIRNGKLNAPRYITLTVTNSVTDSGSGSPSSVIAGLGIALTVKPQSGDFLGTAFELDVPNFDDATFVWPATDLGARAAGFTNNAAIGKLVLTSQGDGTLNFYGTGAGNAVYVDYLDIATNVYQNLQDIVSIASDFTIYFADSSIPANLLDGALNGHIKWVSSYAGSYSGVPVLLDDGRIKLVNRQILNSTTIDSDGDGVPNAYDADPFGPPTVKLSNSGSKPSGITLQWSGGGGQVYRVESATNLINPTWQLVTTVTNMSSSPAILTQKTTVDPTSAATYYRVSYQP
jgi:hypothetical protein